ncbi:MAG: DUF5110 domain-containing protein, partial [Bifidobacteriaceae bacterium]|nr:DUF5110 domain-containing protein [Bifidobacteriaceae bacterium]
MVHKAVARRIGATLIMLGLTASGSLTGLAPAAAVATAQPVVIGDVRVQPLSDTLVRIELKGPNGFEDRATYHAVGRDEFGGLPATVTNNGITTTVSTSAYSVAVPSAAKNLSGVRITDTAGRSLWNYSALPNSKPYLPSPADTPKAWAVSDSPRVVPPAWGYDPMPQGTTDFAAYNGWDSTNDAPDVYVFMAEGDAAQLRSDFTTLFGPTEMMPLKALGLWHSRWWAYSDQDVYSLINQYRSNGFPLDNFVVDTDWRAAGATAGAGYDINTTLFPNMTQFLTKLRDEYNVQSMFNDHPEPLDYMAQALRADELAYRNQNLRNLLTMGLKAWWYDRNWSVTIISPFEGIPKESFGMYLYKAITAAHRPGIRPLIMGNVDGIDNGAFNRAPDLSSHRASLQWTGDIQSSSASLRQELVNLVRSGALTSTPYISSDIGGFYGQPSADEFVRWSQYAAFSPAFRYHSTASQSVFREPWRFGTETADAARNYVKMRYRLLPLLYGLSYQNYQTGIPLAKRLDFDYPQYSSASNDDQYLLGDGVLVAPIWQARRSSAIPVPAAWLSNDAGAGLKVDYFNNTNLSGQPVRSGVESTVNHWWGTSSPGGGVNADNFSARWSGRLTVGAEDTRVGIRIDDGGKLFIDGNLVVNQWGGNDSITYWGPDLQAGTSHDIVFEYYEGSGNARAELVTSPGQGDDSRTVFIPDGRWIDVWSGQTYDGPATVTVEHPVATSPLFVRQGSIVPLAEDDIEYIGEKPWSTVGLDIYPSTTRTGAFTLYEDDGVTTDYKSGTGRSTALTTGFDAATGEVTIGVGAGQGTFNGAVTTRTWKARVHVPQGWGTVTSATVDGSQATATLVAADASGQPFAIGGPSADTDVYEVTWTAPVGQASELRVTFTNPADEPIIPPPAASAIERTIWQEGLSVGAPAQVDLSAADDWVKVGRAAGTDVDRKVTATALLSAPTHLGTGDPGQNDRFLAMMSWTDGTPTASEQENTGLIYSEDGFEFTAEASEQWRRLDVYWGCYDDACRIEIEDGDGKITTRQIQTGATLAAQKTQIFYRADGPADLNVRLIDSSSADVVLAGYAVTELPSTTIQASASLPEAPVTANLSDQINIDWAHFANATTFNRKANPAQQVVGNIVRSPGLDTSWSVSSDFRTHFSWTDGTPTPNASDIHSFAYSWNGLSAPLNLPAGDWTIQAYTSAWGAEAYYTLVDANGAVVAAANMPSAGDGASAYALLTFDVSLAQPASLNLLAASALTASGHSGNLSVPAIAVRPALDPRPALRAALDKAAALDEADYMEDAWADFQASNIVTLAQAVWDNPSSSDAEVLGAADALASAIVELEAHPWAPPPPPPGEGTVERALWPADIVTRGTPFDLSEADDWVHLARTAAADQNRKDTPERLLSNPVFSGSGNPARETDYRGSFSWSDGTPTASASNITTLRYTPGDSARAAFEFSAQANTSWRQLDVYWGCYLAECRLELEDLEHNLTVRRLLAGSASVNQKTTIYYRAPSDQPLTVRVRKVSGGGNVALAAYAVTELPDSDLEAQVQVAQAPTSVDLSDQGNADWAHFGTASSGGTNRMLGAPVRIIGAQAAAPSSETATVSGTDFLTKFSWSNGTPTPTATDVQAYVYTPRGVSVPLDLPAGKWEIDVYTSASGAHTSYALLAADGSVVATTSVASPAEGATVFGKATVEITVGSPAALKLLATASQTAGDQVGNVSIAAIAVREIRTGMTDLREAIAEAEALDPADFDSGAWTVISVALGAARNVAANPASTPEQVADAADNLRNTLALLVPAVQVVVPPSLSALTPVVGNDLEVLPGHLATSGTTVTYAWSGAGAPNDAPIYTPVPADAGQPLTVTVTISKPGLQPWVAVFTTAKVEVAPAAPTPAITPIVAPVLSSIPAQVGTALEVLPGDWNVSDVELTYAWTGQGTPADQAIYTPVADDEGQPLRVTVTATKPGHIAWTATFSTARVTAAPVAEPEVVQVVVLPGLSSLEPTVGQTISVIGGDYTLGAIESYAWRIGDAAAGSGPFLILPSSAIGKPVSVKVTASAPGAAPWSATLRTAPVGPEVLPGPSVPQVPAVSAVVAPQLSSMAPAAGDVLQVIAGQYNRA